MLLIRFALALIFAASTAVADGFPAHFSVSGVAADDWLNIRSEPRSDAVKVGDFGPYDLNIEVLRTSPDGKWGFVGNGEGNGWTAMRFLERQNHLNAGDFPRPFKCFGNEPFWTMNFGVNGTSYSELAIAQTNMLETLNEDVTYDGMRILGGTAVLKQSGTVSHTVMFKMAQCSDGMSDREFGWSAVLVTQVPSGQSFEMGCCTMDDVQ